MGFPNPKHHHVRGDQPAEVRWWSNLVSFQLTGCQLPNKKTSFFVKKNRFEPTLLSSPTKKEKPALVSMNYWFFNRDPYFMVCYDPFL